MTTNNLPHIAILLIALTFAAFFGSLTGKAIAVGAEAVRLKREEVQAIRELTEAIDKQTSKCEKAEKWWKEFATWEKTKIE